MTETWRTMTAAALGREIGAGRIDPRDLTEVFLGAINGHASADQIYARVTTARARSEAAAAAARAKRGIRLGPLDGVPIAWKDIFDTAGIATEGGSALLAGRVPDRDAAVLATAGRAGLVCLGKTHLSELAFSALGLNPVTGTPRSRSYREGAPGGSSSGSAAAVAQGLAAAGVGSDTGGSVRIPAAWNDLVGFKPTHGALPTDGSLSLIARLDTIGPLCRSVEDAGLMFAALGGFPLADLAGADLRRVRLAALDVGGVGPTEVAPARAFQAALDRLGRSGATIAELTLPYLQEAAELSSCIYTGEAYGTWREVIESRPEVMFHQVRDRFRIGAGFSAADYVAAWQKLEGLRARFRNDTSGYDAVLLPSVASLPPSVDRLYADDAFFAAQNLLAVRNPRFANLFGLCAMTLPAGEPACGLMAMTAGGADARLLRLARAMEDSLAA